MSTGPACVARPGNRWLAASCRAAAAASSALDGTHPVFTHVPPIVPRSIITTEAPASRAVIAAANAAPPDPVMARSYRMIVPSPVSGAAVRAADTFAGANMRMYGDYTFAYANIAI
jgi:hypothetical protein